MTETTATEPQAGAAGEPQAGNAAPPAGAAAGAATGDTTASTGNEADDGAEPMTLEEARKLRSENAGLRKRLKPLEEAKTAADQAALTDVQRLTKERDDAMARLASLEAERDARRVADAAGAAARKLGFRNPDLAHRLIDPAQVVTDEATGNPRNLEQLLGEVAKQNPYLVNGAPDFGGGPRGAPATPSNDINTMIRRAAGRP